MKNIVFVVVVFSLLGCQTMGGTKQGTSSDGKSTLSQGIGLGALAGYVTAAASEIGSGSGEKSDAEQKKILKRTAIATLATAAIGTVAAEVFRQRRQAAKSDKDLINGEIARIEEHNASLEKQLGSLDKQIAQTKSEFKKIKTAYYSVSKKKGKLNQLSQQLQQDIKANDEILVAFQKEIENQNQIIAGVKGEQKLKSQLQKRVTQMQHQTNQLSSNQKMLKSLYKDVTAEIKRL